MPFRPFFWTALVTASAVLAGGCGAPQGREAGARNRGSAAPGISRRQSSSDQKTEKATVEAHAHFATGVVHDLNSEPEKALDEYRQAALEDLGNEGLIMEVFQRCLQANQPGKALELPQRATARPRSSGTLFACLGFVYSRLGKLELAADANRIAIRRQPRSLGGYQNLFMDYLQTKQALEALGILDQAGRVRGTDARFLIALGGLYMEAASQFPDQKQPALARALELFQRAEETGPTEWDLRLRLADSFHLLGKVEKAAPVYEELLAGPPLVPFVQSNIRSKLVDIYFRNGNLRGAGEQLNAIIRDNPTDAKACYLRGTIAFSGNDYDKAIEFFSRTIQLNPDFEAGYCDLASAQMSAKKAGDAQATLEAACRKFPQSFPLEYLSALAGSQQKDYAGAVSHFTAAEVVAVATDPKRLTEVFYFQFGAACERNGDYEQAEQNFKKCLRLSPDFAEALNYLGYMWAERGRQLDQARELIERALKAEPDNPAYLDSMAWVLFKLNCPKEALDYALAALSRSTVPDAEIANHLGDIYAALGEHEKACEAWRKSLAIEPNDQVRKKLDPGAR